jgi:hypothetical protein
VIEQIQKYINQFSDLTQSQGRTKEMDLLFCKTIAKLILMEDKKLFTFKNNPVSDIINDLSSKIISNEIILNLEKV